MLCFIKQIFITLMLTLSASYMLSAYEAENFLPPKVPSGFTLDINNDPQICRAWLDGANHWFKESTETIATIPDVTARLDGFAEHIEWEPVNPENVANPNYLTPIVTKTPDGALPNGQTLFQVEYTHVYKGTFYGLFLTKAPSVTPKLTSDLQGITEGIDALKLLESNTYSQRLSHATMLPSVVWKWSDKILLTKAAPLKNLHYASYNQWSDQLSIINYSHEIQSHCSLKRPYVFKSIFDEKKANQTNEHLKAYFSAINKMSGISDSHHCSLGREGAYRPTLPNPLADLLARPWAINDPYKTTSKKGIKVWAATGLWAFEVAQKYEAEKKNALLILSSWYEDSFGYTSDEAKILATRALDTYLTWAIPLNFSFEDIDSEIEKTASSTTTQPKRVHKYFLTAAIIRENPKDTIQRLAHHYQNAQTSGWSHYQFSNLTIGHPLSQAVKRPEIISLLLDMGFDPNVKNTFGKTPLMYAAQYNQPVSAKLLLEAGADASAKTKQLKMCGTWVEKERTALDYAIENDSSEIASLLKNHIKKATKSRLF